MYFNKINKEYVTMLTICLIDYTRVSMLNPMTPQQTPEPVNDEKYSEIPDSAENPGPVNGIYNSTDSM